MTKPWPPQPYAPQDWVPRGTLLRLRRTRGIYCHNSQGIETPAKVYPEGATALYEGRAEGHAYHYILLLPNGGRSPWGKNLADDWEIVDEPDAT